MIFILTICLIFSIVYAGPKNNCNELLINTEDIFSNQNATNGRSENVYRNKSKLNEEEKSKLALKSFLTKEPDLLLLNISFNNNEKNIDILKSIISEKNEYDFEISANNITGKNLSHTRVILYDNNETPKNNLTTPKSIEIKGSLLTTTSNNLTPNESPIDILSSSGTSLSAKENKYENKKEDEKSTTSHDYIKGLKFSNKTDETSSTEISLSEITNLSSDNGEEISLGQKIEFQPSSIDLDEGKYNKAGKEILQNTSGLCGYLLGKRVSFAEPTTLMEFPWTALLLYNTHIRYHCGGSLITTKYVLTAAHCVAQEFYELSGVRLGEYDITEPIDCAPDVVGSKICAKTVDANVVKIIIHHDYSHSSFKNDIALLRLDKDYTSRSFYPICLPLSGTIYDGKTATVAGWGATEKALRSSILLKAVVPIFDISKCSEIYRYHAFNDSTEICASGANEVDVCKGDSGGAIFYQQNVRGKGTYFQLGIISLGVRGCGDKRFLPAVFTKITGFYKWIENNLEY